MKLRTICLNTFGLRFEIGGNSVGLVEEDFLCENEFRLLNAFWRQEILFNPLWGSSYREKYLKIIHSVSWQKQKNERFPLQDEMLINQTICLTFVTKYQVLKFKQISILHNIRINTRKHKMVIASKLNIFKEQKAVAIRVSGCKTS